MKIKSLLAAATVFAGLGTSIPASAGSIEIGQWYDFYFTKTADHFFDGTLSGNSADPESYDAPEGPWTFSLGAEGGTIFFLDAGLAGSRFTITDFDKSIGMTSDYVAGTPTCRANITDCLANPNLSRGTFDLGAGDHVISGFMSAGTTPAGGAFFRVDAGRGSGTEPPVTIPTIAPGVPEPATWMILLLGFGGIGYTMRRRPTGGVRIRFDRPHGVA